MTVCYQLQDVGFRYAQPWVLQGCSLDVGAGEILGIIGANGSGKTSLLKLMAGLLRSEKGRVCLNGGDVAGLSPLDLARLVALVPQESQVLFPFTVGELVLMGRFVHQSGWGWESAEDLRIARHAMRIMEVDHLAERTFQALSGGERHRTVIARALAQHTPILLLDEPTAFLDLKHQIEIFGILKELNRERKVTVVLVSHDLNLASQHCDRLVLLHEGRAFRTGRPEEVVTQEHIRAVYGCDVLIDRHPLAGTPRVTLPMLEHNEGLRRAVSPR
jgi:iron complex transport system ATP-binding protein